MKKKRYKNVDCYEKLEIYSSIEDCTPEYVTRVLSSCPSRGFELRFSRIGVRHSDQMAS
jgi:hypothetical protein